MNYEFYKQLRVRREADNEHRKIWFRQKDPVARLTGWLVIVTALLFVATLGTAAILWVTDHTLDRTNETTRSINRAFLYFGNVALVPYPPDDIAVWGVGISVVNSGNVPARRVEVRYDCPTPVRSNEVIENPFLVANWKRLELPNVIGPKHEQGGNACNIDISKIRESDSGIRDVFIVTEIRYLDGFDQKERVTRMSRKLHYDGVSRSLGYVGPNCTDDDCL